MKKNKKRLIQLFAYGLIIFILSWFFQSQATTTFLFIRHADTGIVTGGGNPPLSQEGYDHSVALIDRVIDIDITAGIDQIYVDDTLRSYETALPLAQKINATIQRQDLSNAKSFIGQSLRVHKGQIILVVADANMIPPLVEELHGSKNLPRGSALTQSQLYIVTSPWYGKVKTLKINL
jgi:phosphohistidine phosphatase SixA